MRRVAIESMNRWFDGNNRHPLVIRGARQVGKSAECPKRLSLGLTRMK